MYDDLAWVESNYGCVAEYNRCMRERDYEDYEPTEEEIAESERQLAEFNAEIERLNGEPSEFVKALVEEWAKSKPEYRQWNGEAWYDMRDWGKARTLDIVAKITEYYGVSAEGNHDDFYNIPSGVFAISVEYADSCYIKHFIIGNLNLEQFKNIFRDLHYAWLSPTMSYNGMYVSNCSLGYLLRCYIKEK